MFEKRPVPEGVEFDKQLCAGRTALREQLKEGRDGERRWGGQWNRAWRRYDYRHHHAVRRRQNVGEVYGDREVNEMSAAANERRQDVKEPAKAGSF